MVFGVWHVAKGFLLLVLLVQVRDILGQQVGASIELLGVKLPSNSLVDFNEIPIITGSSNPTPDNGLPTIQCFTDLEDCCNLPRAMNIGEWYFPNGTALDFDLGGTTYRRNRGPNGPYGPNGELVLGVIRLWRRGNPPERGRFRCEVPTAASPTVNQTLYVNILNIGPVTITASGGSNTGIAGTSFSLVCSATVETQTDTPTPNFDWFFGPNNDSLPSGATPMATVMGNTYTSTLQLSPLQESHAGMYTCRLGSNARLAVNAVVTVYRPTISVIISDSGSPVLGESGYVLNCDIFGDENLSPTITYQWTKDNRTMAQVRTNSNSLPFSSLSPSDAGRYTCNITVSSPYLNSNVMSTTESDFLVSVIEFHNPNSCVTRELPTHSSTPLSCTTQIGITAAAVIFIECLLATPLILLLLCCRRRKQKDTNSSENAVPVRERGDGMDGREGGGEEIEVRVGEREGTDVREEEGERGGGVEYDYPDQIMPASKENYELTQCPAYDTTSKGKYKLTQCPAYESTSGPNANDL